MNINELKIYLKERPGYLNKPSYSRLAFQTNSTYNDVKQAVKELQNSDKYLGPVRGKINNYDNFTPSGTITTFLSANFAEYEEFIAWKSRRQGQSGAISDNIIKSYKKQLPKPYTKGNPDNVFIVGDLHAPFVLEGYLEFCREQQEKYNCGTVVFIGDIIDGNSWSYHEHDADGMSVKTEVNKAIEQLKDWYEVFPTATVLYGNHDLLVARKAKSSGLSKLFIRELGDILQAPKTWNFVHEFIKDDVLYIHGSLGNAITRAKTARQSIVQGHLHTESFVQWSVSERDAIFGLQVGCGVDRDAYAFEYAKPFAKKPVISCGVVLEKGTLPQVILMKL